MDIHRLNLPINPSRLQLTQCSPKELALKHFKKTHIPQIFFHLIVEQTEYNKLLTGNIDLSSNKVSNKIALLILQRPDFLNVESIQETTQYKRTQKSASSGNKSEY